MEDKLSQKWLSELRKYSHVLLPISEESKKKGVRVCCVGGFVRDILMGKETKDYDFVVEGDVRELGKTLLKRFKGKNFRYIERFGTVSFEFGSDERIDLARAREEKYPKPGEHPIVVFIDDVERDLGRRDFTINAMAIEYTEDLSSAYLIDPFGGEKDLMEGKIKVLHPLSISDDPTRMLRAVRFSVKFGFLISEETMESFELAKKTGAFSNVSGDRFFSEIKIASRERNFLDFLLRSDEISVLFSINPSLPLREKEKDELRKKMPEMNSPEERVALFLSMYVRRREPESFEILSFFRVSRKIKEKIREILFKIVSRE